MSALFLVDITYELFRSYFGAPPAQGPDGRPVGAVQGICASMIRLLKDERLTHIAGASDKVIESFRNDLFAGYKTGEGMPEDLVEQFAPADEGLRALGITVWPLVEFEADDGLATGAELFKDEVDQVYICTPDKDLMQCVGGNVRCWDRRRDILYDAAAVREKFGIDPSCIPAYLALVGDSADGIPGLRGWGARSAALMLDAFGRIEDFPASPEDWPAQVRGKARLLESLRAAGDNVALFQTLATLRRDVPLEQGLDDLRYLGPQPDEWRSFCQRHGLSEALLEGGLKLRGEL